MHAGHLAPSLKMAGKGMGAWEGAQKTESCLFHLGLGTGGRTKTGCQMNDRIASLHRDPLLLTRNLEG